MSEIMWSNKKYSKVWGYDITNIFISTSNLSLIQSVFVSETDLSNHVKRLSMKGDKWGERRNKIYDQIRGIELWTVFIE